MPPQGLGAARRKLAGLIGDRHDSRTKRLRQAAFFLDAALPWIETARARAQAGDGDWLSEILQASTKAMQRLSLLVVDAEGEVDDWDGQVQEILTMLDRVADHYALRAPRADRVDHAGQATAGGHAST